MFRPHVILALNHDTTQNRLLTDAVTIRVLWQFAVFVLNAVLSRLSACSLIDQM